MSFSVGLPISLKFGPISLKFWPHKSEVHRDRAIARNWERMAMAVVWSKACSFRTARSPSICNCNEAILAWYEAFQRQKRRSSDAYPRRQSASGSAAAIARFGEIDPQNEQG